MPPLILHNVPEDEQYIGEDGVRRPYAVLFPSADSHARPRKNQPETGAFGKSIRRSRSKTATPAKREDPTLVAADAIFTDYLSNLNAHRSESPQRKSGLTGSVSQPNISSQTSTAIIAIDGVAGNSSHYIHKEPVEVILRGFKSSHQYAAIKQYELVGGRICEDYPRDPPPDQRRFKSDMRDPASLRTRALTPEEKAKALRFAGGENWIKVTFESSEAAGAALDASPQTVLGYLVYAEPYRGAPPTVEDAVPANGADGTFSNQDRSTSTSQTFGPSSSSAFSSLGNRQTSSTLPRSFTTPSMTQIGRGQTGLPLSPPGSATSSSTLDTGTLSTITASSATITTGRQNLGSEITTHQAPAEDTLYCRKIPTARRMQLLPASDALLPQPSYSQRLISKVPLIGWLSSDIIGTQVPRLESGEFDWQNASFYWKACWWLDCYFKLFWGDIAGVGDKDD